MQRDLLNKVIAHGSFQGRSWLKLSKKPSIYEAGNQENSTSRENAMRKGVEKRQVGRMGKLFFFSHQVASNSLQAHGGQHARFLCPPLSPRVCSNSCSLSWWYYLTISSSTVSFSFCLQSFSYQGLLQWVSSSHQMTKVLEPQFPWMHSRDLSAYNIYVLGRLSDIKSIKQLQRIHTGKL